MNDTPALSAYETTATTQVVFKLANNPGDGNKPTCLQMVDANGNPFPNNEVVVNSDKYLEFVNATLLPGGDETTCGTLVIFFEKGGNGQAGSPLKDGTKAKQMDPNDSWTRRVKKFTDGGNQEFTFTAVALNSQGDLANFDPRIIIKPQTVTQQK